MTTTNSKNQFPVSIRSRSYIAPVEFVPVGTTKFVFNAYHQKQFGATSVYDDFDDDDDDDDKSGGAPKKPVNPVWFTINSPSSNKEKKDSKKESDEDKKDVSKKDASKKDASKKDVSKKDVSKKDSSKKDSSKKKFSEKKAKKDDSGKETPLPTLRVRPQSQYLSLDKYFDKIKKMAQEKDTFSEILASDITIDKDFLKELEKCATGLLPFIASPTDAGAGHCIELKFQKLNVYEGGSFLKPQSSETLGSGNEWPMILSVDLGFLGESDHFGYDRGNLYLQQDAYDRVGETPYYAAYAEKYGSVQIPVDYTKVPNAQDKELRLALFYNDVKQCISNFPAKERRIVLTFEAKTVVPPLTITSKKRKAQELESKCPKGVDVKEWQRYLSMYKGIKYLGFEKIGILCSHAYAQLPESEDQLKGQDKLYYKLLAHSCKTIIFIPLIEENGGRLHNSAMLPLMKESGTFTELYDEHETEEKDEGDDDNEGDDDKEDGENGKEKTTKTKKKMDESQDKGDADDNDDEKDTSKKHKIENKDQATVFKKQMNLFREMMAYNRNIGRQAPKIQYDKKSQFKMVIDDPQYRIGDVFFVESDNAHKTKAYVARRDEDAGP